MEHFYIMNAICLFDNKAATIEDTFEHWSDETILVARREYGDNMESRIFISGSHSPGAYGVTAGDNCTYTEDTGLGHRNRYKGLKIDNVIQVVNGKIVSKENNIGLDEKRRIWVMK